MKKIGLFKGKEISEMNRVELLDFARWASKRIEELERSADKHINLDLMRESFIRLMKY